MDSDLQALIAVVAEKWLGYRITNGEMRDLVHEGNAPERALLCLRVADALRAAGFMVIHKAWDGGAVCIVRTRERQPRTVAEQGAPDCLEATLRAAAEVPK